MLLTESFLLSYLKNFDAVPFQITLPDGKTCQIGTGKPAFSAIIHKDIDKASLLKSTSLALGEAYIQGDLEIEGDLFQALSSFLSQIGQFTTDHKALKLLLHPSNSKKKQKEEISAHYDIGNDFYSLWLDETLSYSCAYFRREEDSLYQAQVQKVDYILKKLQLKKGMSLLDIGCGWGFLLIEAAKKYGIHGVGITLSDEQYDKFQDHIEEEGLSNQLEVKLLDYRDLKKLNRSFDRIVSVGMLEHVGRENYKQFLKIACDVMKPGGLFLLHYISAMEEHPGDPFIKKYIFPGGVIPSLREIIWEGSGMDWRPIDCESLRRHYVKTLLSWHDNFLTHKAEVKNMFDEEFVRMWELYLCSCAAAFQNGIVDLHQILFTKGVNNELPMTREFLYQKEVGTSAMR